MKKLGKLSACLLTLCLLTGCNNSTIESDIESESEQETAKEETGLDAIDESTEISSSSIFELYQKEGKITCTIKEQDEALGNVESVIYIDGERAYQELKVLDEENAMKLYGLVVDGNNYSRGDLYGEGIGIVVKAEQPIQEILATYDVDSQNNETTDIECIKGTEGASFEIPNNIEFADLNDYAE